MKRFNFPLWIGILLVILLLLISFFPEKFTSKDPNYQQQFRTYTVMENGKEVNKIDLGFWGPNEDNIMGVDEMNRDIYTRIIYGTRTTLKAALTIALLRLIVAIPIGIIAGIGSRFVSSIIKLFNTVFTAIPTLFFAFFILNIQYITKLEVNESIVAFAIVLTVLGWGKLARQVEERVNKIMKEEFIEGEIAVGKSIYQIAIQNMIPHLIPSLISLMFIEIGMVIFLLAQLSILDVFVGPRFELKRWEGATPIYFSLNPEWGAMLSRILIHNRTGRYWVGLYPALAFAIGILAFNLTGEGLRIEFEKRTSRVASFIRNIGFLVSPGIYIQQIRKFKEYRKPVIIKSLSIIILLTYIFMPAAKSLYPFDAESAMAHIVELTDPKYEGRLTGFEGSYQAGEYIVEKLKEYGLEPYDGENYFQSYLESGFGNNLTTVLIEDAELILTSKDGQSYTYGLDEFNLNSINVDDFMDEESNIKTDSVEKRLLSKPLGYTGEVEIPEGVDYTVNIESVEHYFYIREMIRGRYKPHRNSNGATITEVLIGMPNDSITYASKFYTISVAGELAETLNKDVYEVLLKINKIRFREHDSRNILAVLPGKDWHEPAVSGEKKEIIIIGAAYDGIGSVNGNISAVRTTNAAMNLEIARVLSQIDEELNKTIVFAFWDGENTNNSGSQYYNIQNRIFQQDKYKIFYFDLGSANDIDEILIDIYTVPHFQIEIFDMKNDIEKWLNKKKVKYRIEETYGSSYENIGDNMILKLAVFTYFTDITDSERDRPENINKEILTNMGQYYIDLVTMDENFK